MNQLDLFTKNSLLFDREALAKIVNPTWVDFMFNILNLEDMRKIAVHLSKLEKNQIKYFPAKENIFKAFRLVNFNELKVIILGQDPYHRIGQATGLAFAVDNKIAPPPSLRIIKDQFDNEVGNNLEHWAEQGVLLLNTALTVLPGQPESHLNLWMPIMNIIIKRLALINRSLTWMLWGMKAQSYTKYINENKDKVIRTYHPAAAARGYVDFEPNFNNIKDIQWEIKSKAQTTL